MNSRYNELFARSPEVRYNKVWLYTSLPFAVALYKRAQILVADIWACFKGQGLGRFHDVDVLTMFADYRVPQALVYFDVLAYSDELMGRLKRGEWLKVLKKRSL